MQIEKYPSTTPPIVRPEDAEVDVEVLRAIPQRFCVEDEATANWLLRRIIDAREYAERVKAWAEREHRRAEREEQTLLFLFGRQIERWAKAEIDRAGQRRKSIRLPAGSVGFRAIAPRLVVDSEQQVLAWARCNCPQAIITTERLSKTNLDDYVRESGDVSVDGAHLDPGGERFYLK